MAKILLVDSEADICDFMIRFFEDRNLKAFSAADGKTALLIAERERPDVALLGIKPENGDGLEMLREIKSVSSETNVIVVACADDADVMAKAKGMGAAAYITKPLVLGDLLETVLSNLGLRRIFLPVRNKHKYAR